MLESLKLLTRRLLGEEVLGFLDYYRFPDRRNSWGGPFNGQTERVRIVRALLGLKPDFIVETGTFRGTSTAFLANESSCSVISVENHSRSFGFARANLRGIRNIELIKSDSREALRRLTQRHELKGRTPLFYLDAHWGEDLPLAKEVQLVFEHWPKAVVLVDDFEVPDDPGYGFDDYGAGNALTLDYTAAVQTRFGLRAFFPTARSEQESGARRGCVVFVGDDSIAERLAAIPELRFWADG